MDPLSLTASIAGIVSLAGVVYQGISGYIASAKDASREIKSLAEETRNLFGILNNLSLLVSTLDHDRFPAALRDSQLNSLRNTLYKVDLALNRAHEDVRGKLDLKGAMRRLKWPFSRDETNRLLAEMSRHRDNITLALSADSITRLMELLSLQEETQESVAGISAKLSDVQREIAARTEIEVRVELTQRRKDIITFFQTINPQSKFEACLDQRQEMTGEWLLTSDVYRAWKQNMGGKAWLSGIPGAGKTILSATVIEDVLQQLSETTAVAFFFCDYAVPESQDPVQILGSIAAQLALQNPAAFAVLERYYSDLHPPSGLAKPVRPSPLSEAVKAQLEEFGRVFVVVDALDECGPKTVDVALALRDMALNSPHISTAIFSREEEPIRDILDDDFHQVQIAAQAQDLTLYLDAQMASRSVYSKMMLRWPKLYQQIRVFLLENSQGMFRWLVCQIDYLASLPSDGQRRKALEKLPKTLSMTYERILKSLLDDSAIDESLELARKALHWIAISNPPLTIPQLCEAVSVQDSCCSLDAEDVVEESEIARVCSSLIRKTRDGRRFEFAHFTVREYLVSISPDSDLAPLRLDLASASKSLAMVLLRHLLSQKDDAHIPRDRLQLEEKSRTNMQSLHTYASVHWVYYARDHMSCVDVLSLAGRLFHAAKPPQFQLYATAVTGYVLGIRLKESGTTPVDVSDGSFTPLHLAAILGIPSLCRFLVEERQADADAFSQAVGFPLNAALVGLPALGLETTSPFRSLRSSSKLETVKALLEQRASCTLKYETQATLAAYKNPFQILHSLGDPAVCRDVVSSAVFSRQFITAFKEDLQQDTMFSKRLVSEICNLHKTNSATSPLFSELAAAIKDIDHEFGLDEANDDSDSDGLDRAPDGLRLLRMLETNNARNLLKAITDHGQACRDVRFEQNQTLLHKAVVLAHTKLVRIITDSGFPLDVEDDLGETALHKCLSNDRITTVKLLIDSRASPMVPNKHGRSAWHLAAMIGSITILDMLILSGHDFKHAMQMQDNNGDIPPALAMLCGKMEAALFLLGSFSFDPEFLETLFRGKTLLQLFIEGFWDRRADGDSFEGMLETFRALFTPKLMHQPIFNGVTAHEFLLVYPTGHFKGTETFRPNKAQISFCLQFCDAMRESISHSPSEMAIYRSRHVVCLPLFYIIYDHEDSDIGGHTKQLLQSLFSHCTEDNKAYSSDGVPDRMCEILNFIDSTGYAANLCRILSLNLPEPVMKTMSGKIWPGTLRACDISAIYRIYEALSTNDGIVRSYRWLYDHDHFGSSETPMRRIGATDAHKWQRTFTISYNSVRTRTISYDYVSPESFHGCNVLHAAAFLGLNFMVDFLLQNRVFDVNVGSEEGWTPLHFAARGQHPYTFRSLMDQGADCHRATKDGMLARDFVQVSTMAWKAVIQLAYGSFPINSTRSDAEDGK